MRILQTLLITAITLHMTAARCRRPRPNPVMGALQNILSPANAERTMQMVKMATQRTLGNTIVPLNQPMPVQYSPPILPLPEPCNLPVNQIPRIPQNPMPVKPTIMPCPPVPQPPVQVPCQISNQMPVQAPVQFSVQMPSPPPVQIPNVQVSNPVPIVPTAQARRPEIFLPEKPCPCQRELVYPDPSPYQDLPNYYCSQSVSPPIISPAAYSLPEAPVALTPAQDIYSYPLPSPATLFNPFLPAASPVSTWTPENIPTASSGAKSQHLRKIPIPPPTL